MARFRAKPVEKEAIQWTGDNYREIKMFADEGETMKNPKIIRHHKANYLIIKTLEGNHMASENDWIIKELSGEFYPCKPDIFEKTYEEIK